MASPGRTGSRSLSDILEVMSEVKTFVAHAPSPTARSKPILTVTSGPDAGRVLKLPPATTVTFGRAETCNYSWPDGSLSRVHAVLAQVAGAYVIKDEGSTNGTFVNDRRIETTARASSSGCTSRCASPSSRKKKKRP